ncbi:tryptase-like isoform X2 [Plodia interpunctella]|uniref:tryptase-like isoform X2 n=1 Tax=Plodia interpunctella TaxID=58824 RepID=UPI00236750B2|nr:tryptase-like isoform X2 [Plodia interpunctella]
MGMGLLRRTDETELPPDTSLLYFTLHLHQENASLRIEVTTTTTTKREEDEPEPSFCQTYNPDRPNFNKPGRRICEAKCYEYIWKLNVRLEEDKRFHQCLDWKRKKYQIQFAIGGHPTGPGDYPHMGAIGWKASVGTWVFKCGSSLISEKFVLTAAHCARASSRDSSIADPVPKIVRLGDKNIIDSFYKGLKPTDRNITRIIVHPQFSPPKKYFDIALMELDKEVIFSRLLQPACLWTNFDTSKLGKEAVLTGWGIVATGSLNISPELQAATVDILDSQLCDNFLKTSCNRNWCGMQDDQLCAGKLKGGVDACQGDSGGPLQVKIPLPTNKEGQMHYVLGVISFGIGCAYPNLPGIYTRVSTFIDWIEDNVWGNS